MKISFNKITLWALLIVVAFVAGACNSRSKHKEVGRYVYIDCYNTIHIDRDCAAHLFDDPKTEEERWANAQGVEFVKTRELKKVIKPSFYSYKKYTFCPRCIDDEAYRHLLSIIESDEKEAE